MAFRLRNTGLTERGPIPFEAVENPDPEEWQAIADASPSATFFHTPLWLQIFRGMDPTSRIAARVLRFEDGATAVFPILERKRIGGFFRSAESTAAFCYGGWIADRELSNDHAASIVRFILKDARNLAWRINPIDPFADLLEPYSTIQDTTEVLDLQTFVDDEDLRQHYRHSARKQINKGCRAGLATWVADKWEEWEQYYRIYEARLQQWGQSASSSYPIALFRAFYEARGPKVRLWVVAKDGRILGGNLNLYQSRHCVEWHAAYDCEFFACGVRDYLVDTIIRDARASGFVHYDFNPSGGHEGSRRFKQTFGTHSLPSNLIIVRRGLYRMEPGRRLMRRLLDIKKRRSDSGRD